MLLLFLSACSSEPQDKLHLLNEDPVTAELGSDLDLSLGNYIDTSDLSEEDLSNPTIKLVSGIKDKDGKVKANAPEKANTALSFGSYALLISLDGETEQLDVMVKDTVAPEFTKTKDSYTITEGDDLPDIKADFETNDLTKITISVDTKDVKTDKVGEYKATVSATDTSGNKTEHEVTITVKENQNKL